MSRTFSPPPTDKLHYFVKISAMGKLKVISLYVTAEEYQGIAAEAADIGVTMSY